MGHGGSSPVAHSGGAKLLQRGLETKQLFITGLMCPELIRLTVDHCNQSVI
jgi:hypothetical protein